MLVISGFTHWLSVKLTYLVPSVLQKRNKTSPAHGTATKRETWSPV